MIQKTYRFYNHTELQSVIDAIRSEPSYETASGILLQLYNPRLDAEEELLIEALSDADSALYQAKETGRNKVVLL